MYKEFFPQERTPLQHFIIVMIENITNIPSPCETFMTDHGMHCCTSFFAFAFILFYFISSSSSFFPIYLGKQFLRSLIPHMDKSRNKLLFSVEIINFPFLIEPKKNLQVKVEVLCEKYQSADFVFRQTSFMQAWKGLINAY